MWNEREACYELLKKCTWILKMKGFLTMEILPTFILLKKPFGTNKVFGFQLLYGHIIWSLDRKGKWSLT